MDALLQLQDVVFIEPSNFYAQTPAAFANLRELLVGLGYTVEPNKTREGAPTQNWYARLDDSRLKLIAKCRFCEAVVDREVVWRHKNLCPECHQFTFVRFPPGSTVEFYFHPFAGRRRERDTLTLKVFDYDTALGVILFVPPDTSDPSGGLAHAILGDHEHRWTAVTRDGLTLIAIKHDVDSQHVREEAVIDIIEATEQQNFRNVYLFDGKEYASIYQLPIPSSVSIDEAWHWAPLAPSPELYQRILSAGGMTSRVDYYYQDGRRAVEERQLARMHLFVEHLTALDFQRWQKFIQRVPLDGPGFIRAIAKFCHPDSQVVEEPNIGNVLVALGKVASAKQLGLTSIRMGKQEYAAIDLALNDPDCLAATTDLLTDIERKHPGSTQAMQGFLENFRE